MVQGMPQGVAHYAHRQLDTADWGPCLSYIAAVQQFQALQPFVWDIQPDIVEAPLTADYAKYFSLHPFPRLTILDEPSTLRVEEDVPVAHGHRQRREDVGGVEAAIEPEVDVGEEEDIEVEDVDVGGDEDVGGESSREEHNGDESSEDEGLDSGEVVVGSGPALDFPSETVPHKRQAVGDVSVWLWLVDLQVQLETIQEQLLQTQGLLEQTQAQKQSQVEFHTETLSGV